MSCGMCGDTNGLRESKQSDVVGVSVLRCFKSAIFQEKSTEKRVQDRPNVVDNRRAYVS